MPKKSRKQNNSPKLPKGMIIDDVPSPFNNTSDRVIRRISGDPVLTMYKRKLLTEAQFAAAQKFQKAHTICQGSDNGSMDYSIDRVDTSGITQALQEYQLEAMDVIRQASKELSFQDMLRVEKVAGDCLSVAQYCESIHKKSNTRFVTEQSKLFKDSLTDLAALWGFEKKQAA